MKTISKFMFTVLALCALAYTATAQVRVNEVFNFANSTPATLLAMSGTNFSRLQNSNFVSAAANQVGVINVGNATQFTVWVKGINWSNALSGAEQLYLWIRPGVSPTNFVGDTHTGNQLQKMVSWRLSGSNVNNSGYFLVGTNLASAGYPYWRVEAISNAIWMPIASPTIGVTIQSP